MNKHPQNTVKKSPMNLTEEKDFKDTSQKSMLLELQIDKTTI